MLGVSVWASATMLVNSIAAWAIFSVLLGGIGLTILAINNHTKDKIEERARGFDQRFSSADMKIKRKASAQLSLGKGGRQDDLDEVIDFFHDVGKAFDRGEIDGETIRHNFYTWLQAYWETHYEYIISKEVKFGMWETVFRMYEVVKKLDGCPPLTEVEKKEFWEGEETI